MLSQPESLFEEHLLVLLVGVTLVRTLVLFPPRFSSRESQLRRLRTAFVQTIFAAVAFFIVKTLSYLTFHATANRYFELGFHNLILKDLLFWFRVFVLSAAGAMVLGYGYRVLTDRLLSKLNAGRRLHIFTAALAFLPFFFATLGFWVNRFLKHYFSFNLTSAPDARDLLGHFSLLAVSVLLSFVVGLFVIRNRKTELVFDSDSRRSFVLAAIGLLAAGLFGKDLHQAWLSSHAARRPNILLISIDTLRADHLSGYGYARSTSPNMDRLAEQGVLFETAIAQAPWTLPSHMSIFTGLYASRHRVTAPEYRLGQEFTTLAEILGAHGYVTAAFTGGAFVSRRYGYQGFDLFKSKEERAELTLRKAMDWLRTDSSKPFFLFFHTYEVHSPYDPPAGYDVYSDKGYAGIVDVKGHLGAYYKEIRPRMTAEDCQYVIDKYDGEIFYVDAILGQLFRELEDMGIDQQMVIVLTSDHGEDLSCEKQEHRRGHLIGHDRLYDSVVRIPLIIKAPGVPGPRRIRDQVESVDLLPTILALAGIRSPSAIDGRSLLDLVDGRAAGRAVTFSEGKGGDYKMVRTEEWKLIHDSPDDVHLFSLRDDPEELRDVYGVETEAARALHQKLRELRHRLELQSPSDPAPEAEQDEQLLRELKALGYVE